MADSKIEKALEFAMRYGSIDGGHHKMWVIDQMARALLGCPMVKRTAKNCRGEPYEYEEQGKSKEYVAWVKEHKDGEDGPDTYGWDEGIAP
jgi:hypothetical protein